MLPQAYTACDSTCNSVAEMLTYRNTQVKHSTEHGRIAMLALIDSMNQSNKLQQGVCALSVCVRVCVQALRERDLARK